jgi:hypothetical protein
VPPHFHGGAEPRRDGHAVIRCPLGAARHADGVERRAGAGEHRSCPAGDREPRLGERGYNLYGGKNLAAKILGSVLI